MTEQHASETPPSVIVIGAGIIGASIAWHLAAHHGAAVTIVAVDVGGTATPNSFSWLNANFGNPRFYYDFRRRSMAHWHELAAVPGLRELIRWTGTSQWNGPADELAANGNQHASWGYDVRRADNAELAAREPWLADGALPAMGWGLVIGEEGAVEAAGAARLLVAEAQAAHRARLLSAEVVRLLVDDDGGDGTGVVRGVVTASGDSITADHVVLAAGLGAVPLAATAGITVPVKGRAGLLVHSKPVGQRLLHGLVISNGPHMRQTADGRLLAGTDFAGTDPGTDPESRAEELFAQAKAMFRPALVRGDETTALPDLQLDYYTIGHRPDPEDELPILGASGRAGLTLAVMHSGVTLAAIVGQTIADLVVNGKEDPALANFALSRFDTGGSSRAGRTP